MVRKSLAFRHETLSSSAAQLAVLTQDAKIPSFSSKLQENGLYPLRPTDLKIFQVNIGQMCNQVCQHCHVDAGPDRKEIMSKETMQACINAIRISSVDSVDITGGAPEMNPHFRWFIEQLSALGKHIIVRCNLTIIVANKKYNDLPAFYRDHCVEVVSSLPFYNADRTDRQRGEGLQSFRGISAGKPGST
jgi:radical SAM/Cys-rich protein